MSSLRFDGPQRSALTGGRRAFENSGTGVPLPECLLSVVVPARNEAANLRQLVEEIADAGRRLCDSVAAGEDSEPKGFEIIVVDDSSTDSTASLLDELKGDFPELRSLRLATNGGQSSALAVGFRAARGALIGTLDADLQNDPADFLTLWNSLEGHDAALGWRVKRQDNWHRRTVSRLANRARNAVLGQSIRDTGCALRLFPREHALRLPVFYGFHRFVGPLLLRQGCRIVQVPVNHRPRIHGRSHYNIWNRSVRVLVDLLGVAWLMRRPIIGQVCETPVAFGAGRTMAGRASGSRILTAQRHRLD